MDGIASSLVIDKQGGLSEITLRLPEFYEKLDSPNKILVKLTHGLGQILSGQLIAKVEILMHSNFHLVINLFFKLPFSTFPLFGGSMKLSFFSDPVNEQKIELRICRLLKLFFKTQQLGN